jgi:hypothetical protein
MRRAVATRSSCVVFVCGRTTRNATCRPSGWPPNSAAVLLKWCCFSRAFDVAGRQSGGGTNAAGEVAASTSAQ